MTQSDFIEATNRIEQYYDKEYTNEQRKIMFEELKQWNIERYKKSIAIVIRNSKFLPKIADIIQASEEIREIQNNEDIKKVKCDKCNGTGYIEYDKKMFEQIYKYVCKCTCENGKNKSNNIPTYQEIGLKL